MYTAQDILNEKGTEMIYTHPEATVADALKIMLDRKIGAIVIKDGDDIVGIWTERDLMRNVVTEGFFSKTSKIKDYMSTDLKLAKHDDTILTLQDKFLGKRIRHLFVEKDGKIIGIISTGDVIKAIINEKTKEFEQLHAIVKFDYYEDWKFSRKKR